MAQKTIKHIQFWYMETYEDPYGRGEVTAERIARQGETVDVTNKADLARGEESGAFYTDAELKAMNGSDTGESDNAGDSETLDLSTASVDDVADWMDNDSPTIDDLLELVNANPDIAQKVLDAENKAQSGDPRKGLVAGIQKILDRASA